MTDAQKTRIAFPALLAICGFFLAGCFGSSNPLIGKWALSPGGGDGCPDTLEFSASSMTATTAGIAAPADVTYKTDGANTDVSAASGQTLVFTPSGSGLTMVSPQSCQYTHA